MPNNTKKQRPSRTVPILIAVGAEIVVFLLVGVPVGVILASGEESLAALGIIALYALFGVAVTVGVMVALVQRLREIRRGEEEDAKRY